MEAGTDRISFTSQGARKNISRLNSTPNMPITASAVQISPGISLCFPSPRNSAVSFVSARPIPMSNRLKYPINTDASTNTPKRSRPRPSISRGIANKATSRGRPLPKRFRIVFFTRSLCATSDCDMKNYLNKHPDFAAYFNQKQGNIRSAVSS